MSIAKQEFSDAGRTMLGRANNGELLTFDTMVIGAGAATAASDLWPLTALIDHRFDVTITAQVDQGDGVLVLDGVINSVDIPVGQGFNLCELGLMAHIALEAPALYSVANVLATTPDYIPDQVENPTAVHAFKIKVVIDRATNVTVTLGTSTDIIAENMGPAMDPDGVAWPGVFHEKIANTLRFKRLTPGEGIEITEAAIDPFNITIGEKTLKVDLDVYVPLTYAGMPPGALSFPTIQEAYDHFLQYSIPGNLLGTIYVDAGRFTLTAPVICGHPQGKRIRILGSPRGTYNVPNINISRTNATVTPDVLPNLPAGLLAISDLVELDGGTLGANANSFQMHGVHQVLIPDTARPVLELATFDNIYCVDAVYNGVGARLFYYPTQIEVTAPSVSAFRIETDIASIENFAISGPAFQADTTCCAILSYGDCFAIRIATRGFGSGFRSNGPLANIILGDIGCSYASEGLAAALGGSIYFNPGTRIRVNANYTGVSIQSSGRGTLYHSTAAFFTITGNRDRAILCAGLSSLELGASEFFGNSPGGGEPMIVSHGSFAGIGIGPNRIRIVENGAPGSVQIRAEWASTAVGSTKVTGGPVVVTSPDNSYPGPVDNVGNGNSYIYISNTGI